jgi:hypothetical protein
MQHFGVGNLKGRDSLGERKCSWLDNIKMDVYKNVL